MNLIELTLLVIGGASLIGIGIDKIQGMYENCRHKREVIGTEPKD